MVTFILICLLNCEIPKGKTGFPGSSEGKESACNAGDLGLMPWLGRSPGEGNGNPLQYSCLENPTDRGARWAPWGCKESDMTERLTHTLLAEVIETLNQFGFTGKKFTICGAGAVGEGQGAGCCQLISRDTGPSFSLFLLYFPPTALFTF